jgi:hypothetical protein
MSITEVRDPSNTWMRDDRYLRFAPRQPVKFSILAAVSSRSPFNRCVGRRLHQLHQNKNRMTLGHAV